jgi:hypothetical protein
MESPNYTKNTRNKVFRLRDLKNGLFQIHSKKSGMGYEGTPVMIFRTALKLGVSKTELRKAVNHLYVNGDHYADFDASGLLLTTVKETSH